MLSYGRSLYSWCDQSPDWSRMRTSGPLRVTRVVAGLSCGPVHTLSALISGSSANIVSAAFTGSPRSIA